MERRLDDLFGRFMQAQDQCAGLLNAMIRAETPGDYSRARDDYVTAEEHRADLAVTIGVLAHTRHDPHPQGDSDGTA